MADPLLSAYTGPPSQQAQQQQQQQHGTPHLSPLTTGSPSFSAMGGPNTAQMNGGGSGSGMVQLLPSSGQGPSSLGGGGPAGSPPHHPHSHHARSQSTFVPMHSPSSSMDTMGLNMTSVSRLHGSMGIPSSSSAASSAAAAAASSAAAAASSAAGILATTPLAASLTSPNGGALSIGTAAAAALPGVSDAYSYPAQADGYDVYAEIGSGAFSTVYRGVVRESGEEVAIKVIDLDLFNTNWDEIRREILIMSQLQHPNVVRLKTAFVDGQDLWIVMHFAEAGSAAAIMKELQPHDSGAQGIKDEVVIATILKEVLQALAYFHKHGSIHRDVKAGNILLTATGDVLLADFGVAGTLMEGGDRKKNRQTFTGTPCWMAPEVMEHTEGYDEKADIWSVGITAMELGYGRAPYAKFPPMKVMLLTLQEDPPTCAIYKDTSGYEFSKAYHSMIAKCLRRDPKKRPTARKLLEHKFFQRAANNAYVLENLVKKLPPRTRGSEKMSIRKHSRAAAAAGAQPTAGGAVDGGAGAGFEQTLRSADGVGGGHGGASTALGDGGAGGAGVGLGGGTLAASSLSTTSSNSANTGRPGAGVKLGSWIFDEEDISSFKATEGVASLDLLTGTLQHQHELPHHAHHLQNVAAAAGAPMMVGDFGDFGGGAQGGVGALHTSAVPEEEVEDDADDDIDDVDEPIDEEEAERAAAAATAAKAVAAAASLQQAQAKLQQQQAALAAPLSSTSHQRDLSTGLSAAAAFAAAAGPSSTLDPLDEDLLTGSSLQQPQQQSAPHIDHFAHLDVAAPTEHGAEVELGPLSPSAAFAQAAQGGIVPSLLAGGPGSGPTSATNAGSGSGSTAAAVPTPKAVSPSLGASASTATPTLSSVQGKTRQFLVSEEVSSPPPVISAASSSSSLASSGAPAGAAALDLLSDDADLLAQQQHQGPPSASQQYLNSIGTGTPKLDMERSSSQQQADRAASPLSLDALAPGSATLAYLAAMGGEAPAAAAVNPPSASDAGHAAPVPLQSARAVGLSEGRPRGMSSANEALRPVAARAAMGAQGVAAALASSSSPGATPGSMRSTGTPIGGRMSPLLSSSRAGGAEGLQLLDVGNSPLSGPLGPSSTGSGNGGPTSSLAVPQPSARSTFTNKRGSGTLVGLGLGLLPVIRPTPTASATAPSLASTSVNATSTGAGATGSACSSPNQRPMGSPQAALGDNRRSLDATGSAVFANLQLHSPQQQQQSLLDAGAGSGLTLNIPSPPGSIQTPQQQQQQQQQQQADLLAEQPSSSEPAAAQVGRFQVISSIAEQH